MFARIVPALVMTAGSYLIGKAVQKLTEKAAEALAEKGEKQNEKSAPKDLGTLKYDPKTDSYRP